MPFFCQICGKSFEKSSSLKCHVKKVHIEAGKVYQCSHCERSFRQRMWHKIHLKTVHDVGPPIPRKQCQVCERWFKHQKHLNDHRYKGQCPGKKDDPEEKKNKKQTRFIYKCPECNETCHTRLHREIHLYEAHKIGDEPKKMQCDGCGIWAKNIMTLNKHKSKQKCGTLKRRRSRKVGGEPRDKMEPEIKLEEGTIDDPMPSTSAAAEACDM